MDYLDFLAYYGLGGAHPGGFPLTKKLLENEHLSPTTKVLDIGCGTGQTSAYVASTFNCEVSAIDRHPVMIEKANHRAEIENLPIHLYESSAENLPFEDNQFDFLLSESVTAFTEVERSCSEYFRVLQPNGVLLLIEMTANTALPFHSQRKLADFYGVQKIYTEEDWMTVFKSIGFSSIEMLESQTLKAANNLQGLPELNPSPHIDAQLFHYWEEHHKLLEQFSDTLGYRVFRCKK
ncbi:class I SAM-dependent methyltransferase [Bacillus alkalicellulosilyticus]|uniref:class I SAM-dependent methyltransferase n=1 Tax=Alkalihalobacterium alkalicellulosilyticum TaxID=1912214 RepID=UPI00148294DC|nr:class I SAM-dependent methyltransferase [Bacillus alkalicellulosilyticus]